MALVFAATGFGWLGRADLSDGTGNGLDWLTRFTWVICSGLVGPIGGVAGLNGCSAKMHAVNTSACTSTETHIDKKAWENGLENMV